MLALGTDACVRMFTGSETVAGTFHFCLPDDRWRNCKTPAQPVLNYSEYGREKGMCVNVLLPFFLTASFY